MPVDNIAYAAPSATAPLVPWKYQVRDPLAEDVLIEVHYCGICHSDIHTARSEWGLTPYPCVPGHEFTGIVNRVGSAVTKYKVGDRVGVGCMVGSCRKCYACEQDLEQYCNHTVYTYGSTMPDGEITYGGYGKYVVINQHFVVTIPDGLPMDKAAPLLCAGITTYSPVVNSAMKEGGHKVGVVGLGGLGHMAVQFAVSFGNEVYVISRSAAKAELAKKLGAKAVIISADTSAMSDNAETLDFIIDTVSVGKPMTPYVNLLKIDGCIVYVGLPQHDQYPTLDLLGLIGKRRTVKGSNIGGVLETQQMINYCNDKQILPYIEMAPCDKINECYERVIKGDVMFRFVLSVKDTQAKL